MPTLLDDKPARPASAQRRVVPQLSRDPDTRAIQIGVVGTILIHILVLWLASMIEHRSAADLLGAARDESGQTFDIQMDSDTFFTPPPPQNFVEVNPDAPENTPDQTDNFGALNQQVAQETPTPDGQSESPATEGQTEIETTAIVSGDRAEQPTEPVEILPPTPEEIEEINEALQEAARLAQDPLPGFERVESTNPDGFGSSVVPLPENPLPIPERIEGEASATEQTGAASGPTFRVDPSRPAPRPSLASSDLRPTFISERVEGTSNMGVIAHNALKTEYGAYLSRIIETVDRQWSNNIRGKLQGGFSYPLAGSVVKVKFRLMKSGEVTVVNVDGSADTLWSRVSVDAIAQRAPYGVWTDDMINILGDSQEITFTFHYQ